jgi:hypothetical protein
VGHLNKQNFYSKPMKDTDYMAGAGTDGRVRVQRTSKADSEGVDSIRLTPAVLSKTASVCE